jgi:hypothetical protein
VDPVEFEAKYAYKGGPVIVTDAMANWTASEYFDYWYFKRIFDSHNNKNKWSKCQFFPYKTEFKNLFEAFSMSESRVNYEPGTRPWYFGWSNCDPEIVQILRQHYGRPYFLPAASENNAVDWIFIGGTGLGAHMHVDNVRLPSWQAQLKGTKEWTIAPPPECYYSCTSFSTAVKPGEISKYHVITARWGLFLYYLSISVVLDTNKWYHKTNVLSGDLSVTVGAEYD